ncbi:MAG TPA: sigma-70 family RNA polymerase sigma factor [Bryobacteraceae bacterium]|jgi:RNA polymerase sigma-70 factor (ECF subfamily)|nr:sigma-70 family RNA polymerase sigma factor [Bryobacteraceae bacterium]
MIYEAAIARDVAVAEPDEISKLRRRDPAAMAQAVGRYQHRLYRYLYRLVREPGLADDLFQQTWLNAVRQIGRYDARRSFDTWLFAIAHNAAMDVLRRKTGESLDEREFELPSVAPEGISRLMAAERSAILAAEMEQLPALYREALTLRFEEGMKLEEIAEVTHAPLSTVKSRVQRALEALRHRMRARWRKEDLI